MFRIFSVGKGEEPHTHTVWLDGPQLCEALVYAEWKRARHSYELGFAVLDVKGPDGLSDRAREWLDQHDTEVADAADAGYAEYPCEQCGVKTRADVMGDASAVGPFAGYWCPGCIEQVVEDHAERSESACDCTICTRELADRQRASIAREAEVCGGLSTEGMRLLSWIGED